MIRAGKNIGRAEKAVGVAVLATLLVITVSIYRAQDRINPAVFPLSTDAPKSPGAFAAPAENISGPLISMPSGMAAIGPVEVFTQEKLSDKINGKAELYLAAGFVALKSQRLKLADGPDLWIELMVYDMGNQRNAYSVYSAQQREGTVAADVAPDAYKTANALFMAHGKHYVEIIGSGTGGTIADALDRMAANFVAENPAARQKISERDLFPDAGREPGGIELISADGFGFDRLDNLFTARYRFGDVALTAFLSKRKDTREAEELAEAYSAFLLSFDGKTVLPGAHALDARRIDIMDTFELIFTNGPYFAGIHEAEDRDLAEKLAADLNHKIKALIDGF